jgi:KipI family sensor histidine kinase inhibitor
VSVAPFGDSAVLISLEQRVDERIVAHARAIADAWEAAGLGSAVPAYASVLARFDPLVLAPAEALVRGRSLLARARPVSAAREGRLIEVPTTYDGQDLEDVARLSGLTRDETVSAHASRVYSVFFLGFMPGFAYCGRLDERLVAPRLEVPRPRVPAGSVAVADGQTAVYPFDSPGGWRLIGRTRLRPYDPTRDPPALLTAGDRVRFVEVEG